MENKGFFFSLGICFWISFFVTLDGPFEGARDTLGWWDNEFVGVVGEVPAVWVPDFETVPGLPHSDNLVRFDVLPDMVRALGPVIDKHGLFDILDIEVFSTDESCCCGVHEIGIKRIDIDTERFTWLCADALVNNMDKFVDDPHVLFDMGDVGSLV